MASFRVHENNELLSWFRDNLSAIINHMDGMKGVMGKMPQLSVAVNSDLADSVLTKGASNAAFPSFPSVAPMGLPMGANPAAPIPPLPLFPGFMPCMMPGSLPVNMPGGMPAMSVAPTPSLPGGMNVPSSSEMPQGSLMAGSPFMHLGMLPGNPQMGGLMVGPLGPGVQAGQQGIDLGMGQQAGLPLARMASTPVSLCPPPSQNAALGLNSLPASETWNTVNPHWGMKAATKWEYPAGLPGPVPAALMPMAPSAASLAVGAVDMVASATPLARQGLHGGLLQTGSKEPGIVQGAPG